MAESIVLPLLTEVAKPMVEVVVTRLTEEIHFFRNFEREHEYLLQKIQRIANIVKRMPETAVADTTIEQWLRNALRIIHDVENMIDLLAYDKHRRVVMRRRPKKITRLVISPLKRVYFRRKMGSWIRRINSDIDAAVNDAHTIHGLEALVQLAASFQPAATNITDDLQQVRRNVDTSLIVGRDLDVATVVDMLCSPARRSNDLISSNRLSVIAIVGIGGMGKTTLAKTIYEKNETVLSHFSERIWISDLKELNIEKILNQMVISLGMDNCDNAGSDSTTRRLKDRLGGKRYLLVLDDVWNTKQDLWYSMKSALEGIGGSDDSVILITTRDDLVVQTMHASSVYRLLELIEDHSWSLFEQIAFANWSRGEDVALKVTGKNIVKKCKGVPLAIKSIAAIMNKQRSPHKWTTIEQSELWDIPDDGTGILPSLKLSYNHLSPIMKKCFSLCAFLPKGWWFQRNELICRWMALGLLQNSSNGNITMEDIGEEYLSELLRISFLLVKDRDELGEAITYTLHDLVYNLARSVASSERLYLEAGEKVNKALDVQHLSVNDHMEITSDFPDKKVLEKIYSLEMNYNLPRGLLVHVKYLRVLSLEHSAIEVVPESIGGLKCLKYLDLEDNPIKVLPECVMKLYNLQSLSLYRCKPLSKLPKGLSNLVNLRHLGLDFHLCPIEGGVIGQLNELQTLPPLQLSEGGFQISELGCLDHVKGTLDIKGLELIKSKVDAEESKLSMKSRVEQLRLIWDNDDNSITHEKVLDGLHPNRNLKVLSLKGYGGEKFSSWLKRMNVSENHNNECAGTLCNLIKLELIDCERCQQLPTMGHLPLLKLIEIRNMKNLKRIGQELYGDADLLLGDSNEASSSSSSPSVKSMVYFASLKELQLSGLENLEEWCEPAGPGTWDGFPSLEVLVIEKCWKLKEAPSKFPVLKELTVKYMDSSNPLMKIMSNKNNVNFLTKLVIWEVEELTQIPEEVGKCKFLQTLIIKWCPNLEWIPNLSGIGSLREVNLFCNDALRGPLEGLESCKSLEKLWIDCCPKVETLPDLAGLSRLRNLGIRGMRKMIRQPPDWLYTIPSLRVLDIGNYEDEGQNNEFPDMSCLYKITSLESLNVFGWKELQNLPEQLQHFTALKTLGIVEFNNVEQLPDWLGNLSSLRTLRPTRCKRLKKLPSKEAMDRLRNFRYLDIEDCPLLEQAIQRDDDPEHQKIATFPHIYVDIINSTS